MNCHCNPICNDFNNTWNIATTNLISRVGNGDTVRFIPGNNITIEGVAAGNIKNIIISATSEASDYSWNLQAASLPPIPPVTEIVDGHTVQLLGTSGIAVTKTADGPGVTTITISGFDLLSRIDKIESDIQSIINSLNNLQTRMSNVELAVAEINEELAVFRDNVFQLAVNEEEATPVSAGSIVRFIESGTTTISKVGNEITISSA